MAPSKTAKERYTSAKKSMWPGVSTMLTLHLCHRKEDNFRLNGNPTLPLQKHGVRPRCPFFDAPGSEMAPLAYTGSPSRSSFQRLHGQEFQY